MSRQGLDVYTQWLYMSLCVRHIVMISVFNDIITLSHWSKWSEHDLFESSDAIGTSLLSWMLTASLMVPFFSEVEDNWNKVWHYSSGHVMLLAPMQAFKDTDGIVNGTILFVNLRWLKLGPIWLFWHIMAVLTSYYTDGITNSTSAFDRSRWLNWDATCLL